MPVVAAHPLVASEVLAYLGLLEVQHRSSNDSICRESIAFEKCGGAQFEAQKDSPNALIFDRAAWKKVMEWHLLSGTSSYGPSLQSGEERS